MNGGG
jgi:cysteine desulfurase